MTTTTTSSNASPRPTSTLGSGKLGVISIVCLVVSAAAPLTVTASAGPTAFRLGGLGAPLAMLICAVVLILFSLGFTAMSNHVTNAAAFYAYVGRGLGRPAGLGVAAVSTFAYVVLTASFYGFIGFFTTIAVEAITGASVHWLIGSALAWLLVTLLGLRSAEAGARLLIVLLTLEVAILLILAVAVLVQSGPTASAAPFNPMLLTGAGTSALFVLGFGAFVGFEGTAIYAEEAKDARKTVPIATYIAVAFLGIFYAFTFWILTVAYGTDGVLEAAAGDDFQDMVFAAAAERLGPWAATVMAALVVTSFVACVLAFHNASSRYVFSLGRDRALPSVLGRAHAKHGSPANASLLVSGITAIPIIVCAALNLDPFLQFGLFAYAIGVAAIVFAQAVAAIAVVAYFTRDRRGHNVVRVIVAPALGALGLAIAWILIAWNFEIVSGVTGWMNMALLLPTPLLLLAGIAVALYWRRNDPARYQALADDTGTPTTTTPHAA